MKAHHDLPLPDTTAQKPFIEKINDSSILEILEQELDKMVYALYGLNEAEIQIIHGV